MSRIPIACSHSRIDYEPLTDRLKQGDWQGADQLTTAAILRCHGLSEGDWLRPEQLANIPCADLLVIDQLWSNYSNGHFGLAVQLLLWEFLNEDDQKLADRVGWRVNQAWLSSQAIQFRADAPIGHLPYVPRFGGMRWGWGEMFYGQLRRCREPGAKPIA